ncbi:MAG TPA: RagB/SusD family nutrient uptake outer membrane protein [Gemmatimonadales bacterium]|nr:RagB/SusD family nutrient uptake outer membrane protein [Gemmatimonadales bacterium]
MNFRTLRTVAMAGPLLIAAACTDPTVAPLSTVNSANIWNDPNSYQEYMAKLYGGLVLTSQIGPNDPGFQNGDIKLIDEGTSEWLRLYWYMQELPTDEAVIGWNDPGVPDLNRWQWTATNTITQAMYYRVYFEVVLVNEFLRQTTLDKLNSRGVSATLRAQVQNFRAEARFLRAYAYWVGLDFYGGIPLVTEANPIGGPPPKPVTRDSLYHYAVNELNAIVDSLPQPAGATTYGRATPQTAQMLLAELYLNAGVYTGTADYADAMTAAANVINSGHYTLEANYRDNFTSDNNLSTEVIFAAIQDGSHTQTWGGMTFMVHAGCGGNMKPANYGIDYCWGGYRLKQQALRLFSPGDARGSFIYDSAAASAAGDTAANGVANVSDSVSDITNFQKGAAAPKFTNLTSTGGGASQTTMIDTDLPIFRLGEAYLIYAEAAVRTGTNLGLGLTYFNDLRERAFGDATHDITAGQMTLDTVLAERGRELLFEGRRRTDLIRFGLFTGGTYLWAWKGNQPSGTTTAPYFNLYPIPQNELSANPNLTQNTGY